MSLTHDLPLRARLHHIGLGTPDCAALADFYRRVMGLTLRQSGQNTYGETTGRRLYFVPGEAKTLAFAAFATESGDNLDALQGRLVARRWPHQVQSANGEQFAAGAIALADPDGNRLIFGVPHSREALDSDSLVARLQHAVVASTNAAGLSEFYQSVLGFTLSDNVFDDKHELKTAFLRCSEEHHSFAVFQAPTNRFDHHCYEAGEWALIRDWGDHFAAHDVAVKWGPGRHGPGNNLFLFIHDPDGNWLEISAELEIVSPNRPVGEWPHVQRTLNQWGSAPLRS
jgi:catechol 2,3-dioxygenase